MNKELLKRISAIGTTALVAVGVSATTSTMIERQQAVLPSEQEITTNDKKSFIPPKKKI